MHRKIYENLLKWKNTKNAKPYILLGARQVGKTYIIEEFCQKEYKHFIKINLLNDKDILNLYETDKNSDEKFRNLKVMLNFDIEKEDTILFIDEIQESESLISELKYFCEEHSNVRIICAGSLLGVKLKRFKKSFPVGKVIIEKMYPMDFEEFLIAQNQNLLIDEIKRCYEKNTELSKPIHEKALSFYRLYLITGGMPESIKNMLEVNNDIIKYDTNILKNITESYFDDMNKYIISNSESLKIEKIYKSIPLQLSNESKKFQYSKVQENAKSRNFESALDWLEASNLVLKSYCVTTPSIPLKGYVEKETFKLFISDTGLLNNLLEIRNEDIIKDNLSLYKGSITENFVANEIISYGYSLYYWKSKGAAEIDFLLYTKDGIIPIEVKAGNNTKAKSLKTYIEKYNPKYSIRISTKNFGYDKNTKIKCIPLYAIFCLKNEK